MGLSSKFRSVASLSKTVIEDIQDVLRSSAERKNRSFNSEQALQFAESGLAQCAFLLKSGVVDACVAGAVATTSQVIRAGLKTIGLAQGIKTVSGAFLMISPEGSPLYFADSGVVIDPTPEQLADIAKASVKSWTALHPHKPAKVAFLSFATLDSAEHPAVDKVKKAKELFCEQNKEVICEGPIQLDAALVPSVAERKCPDSPVEGDANILIFPDLNAGNIAYKAVQRLANYKAFGPLLQGFDGGLCDLSRGASAEDIVGSSLLACILASSSDKTSTLP